MQTRYVIAATALLVALMASTLHAQSTSSRHNRAELLEQARSEAIEQVVASTRSDDPFLRANAMEAIRLLPDRALPLVQLALEDEHPAVRFASLVTAGRLALEGVGNTARGMMRDDRSASVRAAARYAAHAVGEDVDLSPLSTMLASPDPGLRSNVAILLVELGDRSAVPMLAELARQPMPRVDEVRQALTRMQVAEAMASLGDEPSMDALRAGAYSNLDEVRVLSVQALGKLDDQRMASALQHMLELSEDRRPPIEVRLAAAEALARLHRDTDAGLSTMLEGASMNAPPIRAQAAMAMAYATHREAIQRLVELLDDNHEQVRLTAAAAILRAQEAVGRPTERRAED